VVSLSYSSYSPVTRNSEHSCRESLTGTNVDFAAPGSGALRAVSADVCFARRHHHGGLGGLM
jgi:hypothetical protein